MKIRKIIAILAVFISLGVLAACNPNGYLCLHNWSEWEIIDSPTCTNPGEEKRVCLVDETHVETRKLDPIGHDWGEWIITTPATDEDQGLETRICKNDNAHVETRRLGSTLSNEQPIGKNEQVKHNKFGYVVTEAGLWLGEQGEEYIVLGYSGKSKTVEIPAYVNNKPITVIGDGAYSEPAVVGYVPPIWTKYMFRDNKNITSITFEEGSRIRHIGWLSFSGCTSLVSFETPETLKSIGQEAFTNTGIWNKTPNNSVVYVGNWAVGYKGNEKNEVEIKSGTVGISSCAFMNTTFEKIKIPDSVKIVGSLAFYESKLFYNAANNNVVYADKWVVGHKGNLGSVNLKEGTVGIADSGLRYGNTLTSITIPSSVESIGKDGFVLCKSLTKVTIADGLKSIGESAFLYCSALENINIPKTVTYIGSGAFGSCRSLVSIVLPDSITVINNGLFSGCNSLKDIIIPESVVIIGSTAFRDTAIRNIVIPKGVVSIGSNAFTLSTEMDSFVVEEGNKFYSSEGNSLIEISTNKLISGFKKTIIPDYIEHIEKEAFQGIHITNITIPDSVLTIGDNAFYNCEFLESVTLGKGLTEIGNYVFSNSNLKTLELPSNIERIGTFAFRECPIESLVLPDNLKYLGLGAFYKTAISSLVIGSGDIEVDGWGAFAYCENLISVVIPSNMDTIGRLMFWACTSLTDVTIENGVTTIKDGAFTGCTSLKKIVIPESVTKIENNVFYGSTNLTIYVVAKEKPQGWDDNWNYNYNNTQVVWNYNN